MGMKLTKEFVNNCRKIGALRDFLCQAMDQVDEKDKIIAELKEQYKDMDVTHTVHIAKMNARIEELEDNVDLWKKENSKLKRALWLARASEASKEVNYWTCQDESSYAIVDFNVRHETIVSYKAPHHRPYKWILIWENVERKCRAKAKEYK